MQNRNSIDADKDANMNGESVTNLNTSPETKVIDQDTITIFVHIKEKIIPVCCGYGTQRLQWLGTVAIARCDDEYGQGFIDLGVPTSFLINGKELVESSSIICETLKDKCHVYIKTSLST